MCGLVGFLDGGERLPPLEDILMRDGLELTFPLARMYHLLLVQVAQELLKTNLLPDHEPEYLSGARVGVRSDLVVLILKAHLPEDECELLHQRLLALHNQLKSLTMWLLFALLHGASYLFLSRKQEEEQLLVYYPEIPEVHVLASLAAAHPDQLPKNALN